MRASEGEAYYKQTDKHRHFAVRIRMRRYAQWSLCSQECPLTLVVQQIVNELKRNARVHAVSASVNMYMCE